MARAKFANVILKNFHFKDEGKEEVSRRERRRQRLMAKIVMLERNYFTEGGA